MSRLLFNSLVTVVFLATAGSSAAQQSPLSLPYWSGDTDGATDSLLTRFEAVLSHAKIVKVGSQAEIIAAMQAANATHRATIIKIAAGNYALAGTFDSVFGSSALPPVSTTVVLEGERRATTVLAVPPDQRSRILTVLKGGRLSLRDISLSGGLIFCGVDCPQNGGGVIENAGGELWLDDCVLTGGGVTGVTFTAFGGAILSLDGPVVIERSTIHGNGVAGFGAGLALLKGAVFIDRTIISANTAIRGDWHEAGLNDGGGLYIDAARVTIRRSTVAGNSASDPDFAGAASFGAGLYNGGGEVRLTDSAVTDNAALNEGAGGGIFNGGRMTIENSTVGGNAGGTQGGGIFNTGTLTLQGTTIAFNVVTGPAFPSGLGFGYPFPPGCAIDALQLCVVQGGGIWNDPAGTVYIATSLIGLNRDPMDHDSDCNGTLFTHGHNAVGDISGCTLQADATKEGAPHDQVNVNPLIGGLEDDGEPGNGHYPLLAKSPLIDAGGPIGRYCTARDQLGNPRTDGDRDHDHEVLCDVGAIEYQLRRANSPAPVAE